MWEGSEEGNIGAPCHQPVPRRPTVRGHQQTLSFEMLRVQTAQPSENTSGFNNSVQFSRDREPAASHTPRAQALVPSLLQHVLLKAPLLPSPGLMLG